MSGIPPSELSVNSPGGARYEVILHVGAVGGGLDLVGYRKGGGWVFRRAVRDSTPELLGEEWIEHESETVGTWEEALELLDIYPWHRLTPMEVHPDFRKVVLDAVTARYAARPTLSAATLKEWKWLCSGAADEGRPKS